MAGASRHRTSKSQSSRGFVEELLHKPTPLVTRPLPMDKNPCSDADTPTISCASNTSTRLSRERTSSATGSRKAKAKPDVSESPTEQTLPMKTKIEIPSKQVVIAAIDFGTTFSSWAFGFESKLYRDEPEILAKNWPSGKNISEKAPTSILIKPDKTFDSFGYQADRKYIELAGGDNHKAWYYFRRFKMKLFPGVNLNRDFLLLDEQGHTLPARMVFCMAIKYLKDDLIENADLKQSGIVREHEIKWVLTVPAIWNHAAKQFMTEVAVEAGIKEDHLQIALEPEAASIYCSTLPITSYAHATVLPFMEGDRYIICDAGGGTVDITVHEVGLGGCMKELYQVSGGDWGGTKVDDAFEQLLVDIFEKKVMARFKEELLDEYLDLLFTFEVTKRTVDLTGDKNIMLPVQQLKSIVEEELEMELVDVINQSEKGVKYARGDRLCISKDTMKALFEYALKKMVEHLKNVLSELESTSIQIRNLILVGGFSESKILQETFRREFPGMAVAIPADSSLAVLKGAVLFGNRPQIITERVCRYCYGTSKHEAFRSVEHSAEHLVVIDGEEMCENVFRKIAERGQSLRCGKDKVRLRIYPVSMSQSEIEFDIYASAENTVTYVTDANCRWLCTILLEVNDKTGPLDKRPFDVVIDFSDTQIQIETTEVKTGNLTRTSVEFLE